MENLISFFEVNEYTVTKSLNLTWDERYHSAFYNLYNHPYLTTANNSGQRLVLFQQNGTNEYEDPETLEGLHFDEDLLVFLMDGVALSVVTVFGIIGNVLNIVVLSEKKLKAKSINRFLIGLAIVDLLIVVCSLYATAIPNICAYFQVDFTKSQALVPMAYAVATTAHTSSAYFTIAVTVERYLVVAYPLEARIRCTPTKAVLSSLLIAACAFIYNIPRWWEYSYTVILADDGSVITAMPLTTELRRNPTYLKYYVRLATFIFVSVIPITALVVLNVLIYRAVKQASASRKLLTTTQEKENSLAFMLVVVVTVFLVCNGLMIASLCIKLATGQPNIYRLESVSMFAIILNSSINFLIYFAYGQKFRSHFLELAAKWKRNCTISSVRSNFGSTLRTTETTNSKLA